MLNYPFLAFFLSFFCKNFGNLKTFFGFQSFISTFAAQNHPFLLPYGNPKNYCSFQFINNKP